MRRVLVTGAAGFVGRRVVADLRGRGIEVVATARTAADGAIAIGTATPETEWQPWLAGCDGVIHLMARVHRGGRGSDADYLRDNSAITERLARDAAAGGVRRLVFVSTIKVNGETTGKGAAFSEADAPAPADAYARSKLAAEEALWRVAAETGIEVAVVRPPLVYGPGVGGNFRLLQRLVASGLPLPLGGVRNARSLVGLGNLSNLLITCLTHPAAVGEVWLAADGEALSLPALLAAIADAQGRIARLFALPPVVLELAVRLAGGQGLVDRLLGDLVVDTAKARRALGWVPPYGLAEELAGAGATGR